MNKRFWLALSAGAWVALILSWALSVRAAEAASIKVCVTAPTSPDATALRVYAGTVALTPDFTGTFVTPTTCASYAAPTTRGTSLDYTARFVNAFGEEGPASNAITFRAPALPPAPALLSVGGQATP